MNIKSFRKISNTNKAKFFALFCLLIFSVVISFSAGYLFKRSGTPLRNPLEIFKNPVLAGKNYIKSIKEKPEKIYLDIKYDHYQRLVYDHEFARDPKLKCLKKKNKLVWKNFVPANIRYKDNVYKAKIRLKGGWHHHDSSKWSLRIKLKGDASLFGMKVFSLQHPKTRNFIYEWLYLESMRQENIVSLRYKFLDVIINGKNMGIYAMEEHFDKRLLEHCQRREGPILDHYGKIYQTNKMLKNPKLSAQSEKATSLLNFYKQGTLTSTQVFDIPKLAKYFALSDLFLAWHATMEHNVTWYYNPITSLLEPIAFDAEILWVKQDALTSEWQFLAGKPYPSLLRRTWAYKLFCEPFFFKLYIKELERVSQPQYLDKLFSSLGPKLDSNLRIIYTEYPAFKFDKSVFYKNQTYINRILKEAKPIAYYCKSATKQLEDHIVLTLGNESSLPIKIIKVTYEDNLSFEPENPIILPPKQPGKLAVYQNLSFKLPSKLLWDDKNICKIKVVSQVLGSKDSSQTNVTYDSPTDFLKQDFIRQTPNIHDFTFLNIDENLKIISFKLGNWKLSKSLIIPEGYTVIANEGLKLNLTNSAKIASRSPLIFKGTKENKILISSLNSNGQGIIVMNTKTESLLKYVCFETLSAPKQNNWELSGAINFYEADVQIISCSFRNILSEDALNIIKSKFSIKKTFFENIQSDAFDSDFSNGFISSSIFNNCGNDAIDISGSIVDLENIYIGSVGDKGISAGESSKLTGANVIIENSEIGITSKDLSIVELSNVQLKKIKVGLTAFQKKSEFGPGKISIKDFKSENIEVPALIEQKSSAIINGKNVIRTYQKVEDLLYGKKYGKQSK